MQLPVPAAGARGLADRVRSALQHASAGHAVEVVVGSAAARRAVMRAVVYALEQCDCVAVLRVVESKLLVRVDGGGLRVVVVRGAHDPPGYKATRLAAPTPCVPAVQCAYVGAARWACGVN